MELPLLCQARYGMISVAHLGVSNAPWFRALPFSVRSPPRPPVVCLIAGR